LENDLIKEQELRYVVYQCIDCDNGEIIYIGAGNTSRPLHCTSGVSHSYELNKLHFAGKSPNVEVIKRFKTREEALLHEKELIKLYAPRLNIVGVEDFASKISKYVKAKERWEAIVLQLRVRHGDYNGVFLRPVAEAIEWCLNNINTKALLDGVSFAALKGHEDLPNMLLRANRAHKGTTQYSEQKASIIKYITNENGDLVFKEFPDIEDMLSSLTRKSDVPTRKSNIKTKNLSGKIPPQSRPSWVPTRKGNK
jgi:hypothetical protein